MHYWREDKLECRECGEIDGHRDTCSFTLSMMFANGGPVTELDVPRVPYPGFCHHVEKCAGKSSCQRDPNCIE